MHTSDARAAVPALVVVLEEADCKSAVESLILEHCWGLGVHPLAIWMREERRYKMRTRTMGFETPPPPSLRDSSHMRVRVKFDYLLFDYPFIGLAY